MSFIQKLFTSRDNQTANVDTETGNIGNTFVGQQDRIWWNPDTNAFYYSDGSTPGGILITGGASGNGTVGGANTYVQYNSNGNFAGDPNFTFNSATSTLTITNIVANTITGGAGGSNTQVLFNDSGNINGNAQFTFNKATNTLTQTGTAYLGNVLAAANNTSTIGGADNRFYDLWLGSGNINLIDDTLNINQQLKAENGNIVITGGNGLVFGQFAIYQNIIETIQGNANITIGKGTDTGYLDVNRPLAVNSTGGGDPAFLVEKTGVTEIRSYGNILANTAMLLINGTTSATDQPRNFEGTLIQATAQDNTPARMSADAFGVDGSGQNAYASWAARVARGNVTTPSQTQAGDMMFRFTSQGYSNSGAYIGSIIRYNQVALENFATGKAGTRHNFAAAPVGTATIKNIANIDGNGITFSSSAAGGPANIGITFQDGSYQNTAYISTSVVRSLTAGSGIALSSNVGNITIQNTGVLGVVGTTNQINVANVGNVLTLSLPQNLNTTANVQLNQLTVNDLIILGNVSNVIPSVVGGKIIYVANTATTLNDIDVSGLYSGNAANNYSAGMIYSTVSNTWVMDIGNSVGITSEYVFSNSVVANSTVYAGNVYASPIAYPTLVFRGDSSLNDVIGVGIRNHYQGADASTAFIAAPNNGEGPTSNYFIAGINSNVYANANYAVAGASDGYVRVNGGNLVIDTETAGKVINFATGGVNATSYIRGTISDSGLSMVGNVTANNMISTNATIGGTVSATGNITGGNLLIPAGIVSASGNINGLGINGTTVSATGNVRAGNVNTAGAVSAAGNVVAGNLVTSGFANVGNITTANITAGNITSAIISTTGNITGPNVTATIMTVSALLSVSGNITGGNFLTSGLISTTGNVTANYFLGDGGQLSNISISKIANGTSQVNIPTASGNANISIGGTSNVAVFSTAGEFVTGIVSASGNIVTGANVVTPGAVINSSISTSGNIIGANIRAAGLITATGNVTGGNLIGQNLTAGRVAIVGSGKEVADDGDFTYNSTTNVLSVAGNINAANFNGNIVSTGNLSTTGNVIGAYGIFSDGNTVINAGISTTGNITAVNFIGNIIAATNISNVGNLYVQGNIQYNLATGDGGNVVQLTNKATAVTCNGRTGRITTSSAAMAGGSAVTFTVNNTYVEQYDLIILNVKDPVRANTYHAQVNGVGTNSFNIMLRNIDNNAHSDAIVLSFAVVQVR